MASEFLRQYFRLVLVTAIFSILLSAWSVWADPIVNNDGVYYFRAAEKILIGGWQDALSVYSWPFYPAFIAYLSKLTGAEVVSSAYVLNALLGALLVAGFLAVVFELGGDRKTLVIAAVVILAFPTLNKYRSFVIRDIGYLAFYLWSLTYLFKYWKHKQIKKLLGWFVFASIAALFRVEGVAMLVAVPIIVFSLERTYSGSRWSLILLYVCGGVLMLGLLGLWMFRDALIFDGDGGVGHPMLVLDKISAYMKHAIGGKLDTLKEHFAGRYYVLVYVIIIVFVTLAEIIRRLAVVYAVLAFWGLRRGLLFPQQRLKHLWLALIVVNTLILIGSAFFISIVVDRYALTISVTILLSAPFVLNTLWRRWRSGETDGRNRWVFPILILVITWVGIKGLDVFTDKQHLYEAGRWLAENTATESTLHSNNLILIYYSGKDAYSESDSYSWRQTYAVVKSKKWKQYDYLAIELNSHDYPWIEWLNIHLHGPPIKRFDNDRGDSVLVYSASTPTS